MVSVRWTNEAEDWLSGIHDYISRDNPEAASRVVAGIYEKAQILRDFPNIGYIYKRVEEGPVRVLLYGHYRIAYLLRDDRNIEILGVFHGAMDMERYLPKSEDGTK